MAGRRGKVRAVLIGAAVALPLVGLLVVETTGLASGGARPPAGPGPSGATAASTPARAEVCTRAGIVVTCPVGVGTSGTVEGQMQMRLVAATGGARFEALGNPKDPCLTTCFKPGFACVSARSFTAAVTAATCRGRGRVRIPLTGPGGDLQGLMASALVRRTSLASSWPVKVFVQLEVAAERCSSAGCSGSVPGYAGWRCAGGSGCPAYFGNVAMAVPASLVGATPGTASTTRMLVGPEAGRPELDAARRPGGTQRGAFRL